ncbi:DMT family transporter [Citricoccus sp. NR2]|uniref:DMT family transporter n=1 Tax=Citricoccus sp. NR2 TaxID=3004095 RepID=UPI0022DDAA90|nr:DMT family transporter [Citricoccus sp. NR2]WBL20320.1 DMT family transporter [Citricoccus sp. NR2]
MNLLLLGVVTGFLLPIQGGINARLRAAVVSPWVMSLVSFTVGLSFLTVLTLSVERSLFFDPAEAAGFDWWSWLGGPLGVVAMTTSVLLVPKIGAVQTAIIPLAGQILMGLLVDQFAWFGVTEAPLTLTRVAGALLMLAGVLAVVLVGQRTACRLRSATSPPVNTTSESRDRSLWWWRGAGVIAGAMFATQAAINGHLGQELGSSLKASTVSFATGVVVLLMILLATRPRLQLTRPTAGRNPWWMWLGGVLGSVYVAGNAFLVPQIGAGATVVAVLLGMMAGSLLVDHFGLVHVQRKPVAPAQLLALVVMALGVILVRLV